MKQFKVREGFEIELMASEPAVTQPLFATWDSRGRMWVVQYRQYQFPAGLKIVRYDQHLRAVFDCVPEPLPHGPKGADKITVFEDTDGDGYFDTHKDVITGLNIATSVQIGPSSGVMGIWVLQPPYLLFYPGCRWRRCAGWRSGGALARVRAGGHAFRREQLDLGAGWLALRREREHDDRQRERHDRFSIVRNELAFQMERSGISGADKRKLRLLGLV